MKPIIYQIFSRLYLNPNHSCKEWGSIIDNGSGKMNAIDAAELKRLREMGISHVWLTGVIRHATTTDYTSFGIPTQHADVVKGRAGSPYAICDYYDVDPDLAEDVPHRMEEFTKLVARIHRARLKVVIDFVPNHVARQYHSVCKPKGVSDLGEGDDTQKAFSPQNNFYYIPGQSFVTPNHPDSTYAENPARATGNDCFTAAPSVNDWYETVKLNYGVDYLGGHACHFSPIPSTWKKMRDILLFWAAKGVDGFRCDMAEMVPAEFWAWAIPQVKAQKAHITFIAEVYNPAEYRHYLASGFDWLYDKVGMYDALRSVTCGQSGMGHITWAWQQTADIAPRMLRFLENHDEQRIASTAFAGDARRALPAAAVALLLQEGPFMLYAGQEYGERGMDKEGFSGTDGRTTIFDYWSTLTLWHAATGQLTPDEQQLCKAYQQLMGLAQKEEAIENGLMFDLMYVNPQLDRQFAFLRKSDKETLLVVANFSDEAVNAHIKLPAHAFDYLKMSEGSATVTSLMNGKKAKADFHRDAEIEVNVVAWGTEILKISN